MKLKKLETSSTDDIPALDAGDLSPLTAEVTPPATGLKKAATLAAFLASLLAAALIGAVAAMMYVNWDLIANA